jgi:hypothetical protein
LLLPPCRRPDHRHLAAERTELPATLAPQQFSRRKFNAQSPKTIAGTSTNGSSDLPAIDIEIEKNKVREFCLDLYPDRERLYEMIYESRF